jgi:hypothetical protein
MSWFYWLVAFWLVLVLLTRYQRKKGARRLVEHVRHVYGGRHEYRDADPARFPHLDLRFYDETARILEREGFVRLGDLEDVTINEAPDANAPVFIRGMSGDGGRIVAGIYHFRPTGWKVWLARLQGGGKQAKVVDFETHLSDGSCLTTSNATGARLISLPPQILVDYLPSGCAPLEVLEIHRRRLAGYLAEHPEAEVLPITTNEQAIEAAHRIEELKAEFRRSKGGILEAEEVVKIGSEMTFGAGEARRLAKEIEKLREPEKGERK